MRVPSNEIEKYNAWADLCVNVVEPASEKRRLERVLYALPFQCAWNSEMHDAALASARVCPDVPASAYASFKLYKLW